MPHRKAPGAKRRILLADGFKPSLEQIRSALVSEGYEVAAALRGEEAAALSGEGDFSLAIIGLPWAFAGLTGIDFARKLRAEHPKLPIIFLVDRYPLQTAVEGLAQLFKVGVSECFLRPVELQRLLAAVAEILGAKPTGLLH